MRFCRLALSIAASCLSSDAQRGPRGLQQSDLRVGEARGRGNKIDGDVAARQRSARVGECGKATVQGPDEWLHEPKCDGWRIQIVKDGRRVRLFSRSGTELTKRLLVFVGVLQALPVCSAVIDGEARSLLISEVRRTSMRSRVL